MHAVTVHAVTVHAVTVHVATVHTVTVHTETVHTVTVRGVPDISADTALAHELVVNKRLLQHRHNRRERVWQQEPAPT